MDRKYDIQLNLSPYANYFLDGGNTSGMTYTPEDNGFIRGSFSTDWTPQGISSNDAVLSDYQQKMVNRADTKQAIAEKGKGFLDKMNSSGGGGWANAIAPAATNIANAFLDTEASTADRVAGALGIPALANQWRADTSKGDSYLKAMTSALDSMSGKNYIQDASSTFGANNAVKLNNKQTISPISPASGLPSLEDFKGNWWRNMGASVAQGAASGSVGGPWGAAGGALTGFFGSLGGLFGRSKRAEKAYDDFLHKRDTLMSAQQNAFNTAVKNQTLSNMQALANGNMSQRISDMANIRAYGGNLYSDGGSIIDPDPETITADDIEKARLDSYYPNRLSDTFLGQPVGYLSEDAGLESYAPIIGTVQDWDKFTAEPTVGNAIWAGLSTIGDIPWLKMGGIGLRALKRGWDAYNTYRKVAKALNKAKAVGEFGEAADALRNLRKVMPDPEYTQMRRQIIAPTRDKDVIEGVKDYYKHEGAKLASQLGKQFKNPSTYLDFAVNFAQDQIGGGDNYIPEDKRILSNNGVVFSYNPSSRTWISENSGSKGEKIVVPAEEMQQNLQNGLGKIINNNTKAYGGNLFDGGGDLTDEQQIALADIQANPRILFTPKYSQWRDYIRRTSPDYLDRLYTSLPYEQQQDIYQNDREAWGALSNEAKGNFGGAQVRKKTDEVSPYVAGALGLVGAAPAWEAVTMFPMLENGLNAYFGYEGAKDLPSAIYDTYNYAKNGDWSNAGLNLGRTALDGLFLKNGISAVKNTAKEVLPVVKGKYRQNEINSTINKAESEISDKDWDIAYNAAIKANDMVKAQRLRNAHFLEKAGNDAISKNGHPEIMYHSVDPMYDPKFNSFDTNIEGRKTFVYTTNNKNMSRSYTKGQEFNKDMYRPAAEYAADAAIAENRNGLLTREQLIDKYIKEFSKGLESKANTTKELYGKLNNPWIIEGNYHNWDNIPTRFSEYNEIVPVERSTREVEDLIQINNEIGNKKYDGAIMNNISDWGSTYLQPERDIFTLNTLEPTVKPNPDFYGTVYSFENPKNLKYRDAITYDDAGNIIPLSKRDNFNINDLRYGLIPFLGLTGYGLTNNTEYAMGGNIYTDLSPNMMSLWNNKQQIDQQKTMNQQFSLGLGNSSFVNKFETGGPVDPPKEFMDVYHPDWGIYTPAYANMTFEEYKQKYGNPNDPDNFDYSPESYNSYQYRLYQPYPNSSTFGNSYLFRPEMNVLNKKYPIENLPVYRDKKGDLYLKRGIRDLYGNNDVYIDDNTEDPTYNRRNKNGDLRITPHKDEWELGHTDKSVPRESFEAFKKSSEEQLLNELRRRAYDNEFYSYPEVQKYKVNNSKQKSSNTTTKKTSDATATKSSSERKVSSKTATKSTNNIDNMTYQQMEDYYGQKQSPLFNAQYKNTWAEGGQMTSLDVPDNMQYFANGGTHEENPYGGIQVGTDQQGTPNLVEEGEFRWNNFVFSDRINVDANLLSSFNLAPSTKHQNKKAAKGKLSYADMAKKYAKRNKELENDPITKNSMEAFMQRLANAQEYQKKDAQLEAQKQNELQDYKTALNKQNNNPMYGTMKYNGMGNAATQQGVNSGVDAGMGNPMSNADLSNVNRSGNEMMAAYGGNLFAVGGDNGFPDYLLSEAYKRYRESQYPTIKDNGVTLKAKPQDFTPWVSEPDVYPIGDYFFSDDSPTKYVGLSPTGIQPYIHPAASPINTYQYTPYKSRIGSNLPAYSPHSLYTYEYNGEVYEPQYFRHSNRIEDNYIPNENYDANVNNFRITSQLGDNPNPYEWTLDNLNARQILTPWNGNFIGPTLGDNTNLGNTPHTDNYSWGNTDANTPFYQNEGWGIDMKPTYMKVKNPNYNAPAVSTYATRDKNGKIMYDPNGKPFMSYPRTYEGMKSSDYPNTKVIGKTVDNNGFYLNVPQYTPPVQEKVIQPEYEPDLSDYKAAYYKDFNSNGINTTPYVQDNIVRGNNGISNIPITASGINPTGVPSDSNNNIGDTNTTVTNPNKTNTDSRIGKTTTNTNPDAAIPSDPKEAPLYSTAGKYAQFGKGIMPMIWDWANKTNVKYDPYQRDADRLEALANEGPVLRTADTIGGYRAPNLMDVERLNNSARAEGLAQMQAILDAANGNRGFVGAQSAQNNYNTQKGIGDNYVKAQEANNTERLQTDQFNHGINVANQNAINAMYQDNQRAEQAQHQAALSGTAQAAALRQRENLHADEVNTERMKNRATNQAAAVDNALNYFTTQAMENQELNTRNNDPTNPYWIDKDGRTHYVGDSGLTQAIRDAFGNDEYGRNGTFTGKRLEEWNDLTKNKKYSAKYLKEHPELWQHLVAQQREANKIDADKAEQARMEELEALRGTYQSNLARLNALKDSGAIISDPSYNLYTGWADEDYSGNQGLLRTRNQALDQYITQIGNNYDRYLYEKQLAQAKALGGYLNDGQNNNNYYYSYTRI